MARTIPGINIQWPWSELLLTGEKTIETRSYPIPKKHIGKELAVIETPGPNGKKMANINKARITGTIIFSECFEYSTKVQWENDFVKHLVKSNDSLFGYKDDKEKWAWIVSDYKLLPSLKPAPEKRGIIFATSCDL